MPIFAVPSFLAGGAIYLASLRGALPPEGTLVFYPALMLYNYASTPLATFIMLVAVTLAVLWLPQALHRLPNYRRNGLAALLALAATALACQGSLPQLYMTYRHIDRAVAHDRLIQVGARLAVDDDNFVVVCDCDRLGLLCRCQYLTGDTPRVLTALPEIALDADGQAAAVVMDGRTIFTIGQP